jgi:glycine dehydrogenase subunit 1
VLGSDHHGGPHHAAEEAVLSGGLHPHYVETARTMARFTGDALVTSAPVLAAAADDDAVIAAIDADTACVVVQYPDVLGRIPDLTRIAAAQAQGALLVAVVTEPVALGLLEAPGAGRGHRRGEGQSLGVGLQFGGPYLGLFGCREKFVRQMPGRLCGETVDAEGRRGFVLTLSTREQHIRREKATSNICTNSGLCALAFSIHLSLLGGTGLERMAHLSHARARATADRLAHVPGVEIVNTAFFNEFAVTLPRDARQVVRDLADRKVLGGVSLGGSIRAKRRSPMACWWRPANARRRKTSKRWARRLRRCWHERPQSRAGAGHVRRSGR